MPRLRTPKCLGLSEARYRELYYACLQYPEWKQRLEELEPLRGRLLDGQPKGEISYGLDNLVICRAEVIRKIDAVEKSAKEAGGDIAAAVLKGVTTKGATYQWLVGKGYLYAGPRKYYEARRRFYQLVDELL